MKKSKHSPPRQTKSPVPGITEQFDFQELLKEFKPAQQLKGSKSGPNLRSNLPTQYDNEIQDSQIPMGPPVGITLEQIEEFFKSVNSFNIPKLTKKEFKLFLQCFPKNFTNRDVTFLMSGKHELDPKQLYDLLCINNVADFDPVQEAFRMMDVEGKGYITLETFQETFCKLNNCTLTLLEMEILKDITDLDKDGKISLEDFRNVLKMLDEQRAQEKREEEEKKLKQRALFSYQ